MRRAARAAGRAAAAARELVGVGAAAAAVGVAALREQREQRLRREPAEQRARVFDRFQRGADTGVAGSGLGLAIVRAAARQQGAVVRLTESPLGGLRAEMAWPG